MYLLPRRTGVIKMEHKKLTLGSLFDGIGGFPLAGKLAGITPVWASEIEPFPIRVTEKRLPEVKHYGDVHALNGAEMEPVDIITFGSPCQDLSIAGRREGLSGSRSNLFHEAVRIIREMREKTNGQKPRWAVWENVPGALSSQNGQDFRCVLESLIRIKEPEADVPLPGSGKWMPAGEIMGNHYSLAWRIIDAAQGWGVAQRRKRIFAVLDLDGQCAGKVLFESEGMSGYTPPRGKARKGAAGCTASGAGASGERDGMSLAGGFCTEHSADSRGIGYEDERAPTLRAGVVPGVAIEFNPTDSRIKIREDGVCQTLLSRMGTGGNQVPLVFGISADQSNAMLSENPHAGIYEADTSRTLDCNGGSPACNQGGMIVVEPVAFTQNQRDEVRELGGQSGTISASPGTHQQTYVAQQKHPSYCMTTGNFTQLGEEKTPPIMARDYKDPPVIGKDEPVYSLDRACFNAGQNAQNRMNIGEEKAPTLVAEGPSAVAAPTDYLVRRLTPGECCRLQGYPDGWCENLGSQAPSNRETDRWEAVFEEWRIISGSKCKPKTRRQVIRWLQNPHTDSAEYKAYGNSVAVPCVFFVLAGIVWATESEVNDHENA